MAVNPAAPDPGARLPLPALPVGARFYRPLDRLVFLWVFLRKNRVLWNNLAFFRSLDALVAPERHCVKLRTKWHLDELRMIHARHGAGDRRGGFDEKSGAFDFTLLPGRKYIDRLTEINCLRPGSPDRHGQSCLC